MIPRKYGIPVSLAALAALSGCAQDNLPDYSKLGPLRVLALKADKPEVSPGDSVTLTPVVSDLDARRSLSWSAVACTDPGVGLGATPDCSQAADRLSLGSGAIPSLAGAKQTYTGVAPAVSATVPSGILQNRSTLDQFNGVAYLVVYTLTASDGAKVVAFKRIIASTRTPKNTNPSLADVLTDSGSLASLPSVPSGSVNLTPSFAAGSVESYPTLAASGTTGTASETLVTTWFVSDGDNSHQRTLNTDPNVWTPPTPLPSGRGMVFVVVVRDGRGGEDFRQIEF